MSRKLQEKLNFARDAEDVVEEEPVKRAAVRLQAEEKEPGFAWLFSGFIACAMNRTGRSFTVSTGLSSSEEFGCRAC